MSADIRRTDSASGRSRQRASAGPSNWALWQAFRAREKNPSGFLEAMAARVVADLGRDVAGVNVLDLGCGRGEESALLQRAGAAVTAVDYSLAEVAHADAGLARLCGDGRRLPFPDGAFDGVFCSNVLEHTPEPVALLEEVGRVTKPGGWAWVSWTNWMSPVGGHEVKGLHYLGPRVGYRLWERLFGTPSINALGDGLWPTWIGPMLRHAAELDRLELVDAWPRYYPSQRWLLRVPGLREVATWNCVLQFERPLAPADPL